MLFIAPFPSQQISKLCVSLFSWWVLQIGVGQQMHTASSLLHSTALPLILVNSLGPSLSQTRLKPLCPVVGWPMQQPTNSFPMSIASRQLRPPLRGGGVGARLARSPRERPARVDVLAATTRGGEDARRSLECRPAPAGALRLQDVSTNILLICSHTVPNASVLFLLL